MVFNAYSHSRSLPSALPIKTSDQQLTFCIAPFSLLPVLLPSFLRSPSLRPFLLPLRHSGPRRANGNQQLQGERVGQRGVSGSRGVTVLVKSSQGLRCGGIASPFKGCAVTSIHPLHPFSSSTPPPLTPLRPPLALLFLGSQGSRQPRVNKVIPGVGQKEAFFFPPSSLLTPTSSKLWAPHFTPLNPAGTASLRASRWKGLAVHVKVKPSFR